MSSLYSLVLLFLLTIVYAAGDEDIFEVQPEIYHVFREEVRQPSVWISQLFTVISLSPWLVLLLGWLHIGITPKQVCSHLTAGTWTRSLSIVAFIGYIISLETLFYFYWTQLNLFQTLGIMSVLSVFTFFAGQRALSSIQQENV